MIVANDEFEFVDLQAAVVVDAVVVGFSTILAVYVAVKPGQGLAGANGTWVKLYWIFRIDGQVEPDDTVAAMGSGMVDVESLGRLCGLGVRGSIKLVCLAMADVFRDGGLVVCGPVVEMQVDGLFAAVLG